MIFFLQNGSSRNEVAIIQSTLKKIGLYEGKVDGIFGEQTREAVLEFQKRVGLTADGIVGPNTDKALKRYMLGYTLYLVKEGDTIQSIAENNNSTVNLIRSANSLRVNQEPTAGDILIIPFNYEVVSADVKYTYSVLEDNMEGLLIRYPFIDVNSIGKSVLGNDLIIARFGVGPRNLFINATHHALEWINSTLLMQVLERLSSALINGERIGDYDINYIFNNLSIYFVPMVNPDGVEIVNEGLSLDNPYYEEILKWNTTGRPLNEVWQANIRGVDLNHNYDAGWEQSKQAEAELGITGPGPTRYSGPSPFSEPETQAMRDITQTIDFYMALAYHSQGEVIYWNFNNLATDKDREIGESLADASGYTLDTAQGVASYAGYKDWFIQDFRKPGYTVETGMGTNPLPLSQLPQIYEENIKLILKATEY